MAEKKLYQYVYKYIHDPELGRLMQEAYISIMTGPDCTVYVQFH